MKKNKDPLGSKSLTLALLVVKLQKRLQSNEREYMMSKQLFTAGTGTGAMIRESFAAESNEEFVNKFHKARQHCYETIYWLELLYKSKLIEKNEFERLQNLTTEIIRMIASSIKTKKKNIKN